MPVYLFTIVVMDSASGRQIKEGVMEYKSPDLDRVYQGGEARCRQKWGNSLESFDCVMVSKQSVRFKQYLAVKEGSVWMGPNGWEVGADDNRPGAPLGEKRSGGGRYRAPGR